MANNGQKSLSEVFKELERNKDKQVKKYIEQRKAYEEQSFIFHIKHRTKLYNLKLIFIALMLLTIISLFFSNYIFAIEIEENTEERKQIGTFEENKEKSDIYQIISKNISVTYQKEIVDKEEEIEFEVEYMDNKDLPKDETNIIQEGINGSKLVTYVNSYENNQIIDEKVINEMVLQESQKQIIEVGSSEVLKQYNIHIGDILYVSQDIELRKEASEEAESLITIPAYYDVKTIEVVKKYWLKVSYDGKEGYILSTYLTSETLTPEITEMCRKKKILDKVSFDMALNEPSGLQESDFERILSNQSRDVNNVFKDNYKAFYDVEEKYNINGVFVAAIAMHESDWAKSRIAMDKKNLFGFGAYDATPYESALTFETYAEGIDKVALWLSKNYINVPGTVLKNGEIANGSYFNGPTVSGVNTKYATDTNWANRVFSIMEDIYSNL